MLFLYVLNDPVIWAIPLLIQIACYIKLLKRMGKRPAMGVIPPMAEHEMTEELFRRTETFWRPAVIFAAMYGTVMIIGDNNMYAIVMMTVAFIVYGVFLARLYWRLARQFGKGRGFALGMILIPIVFLPMLAFGRNAYLGKRAFEAEKKFRRITAKRRRAAHMAIAGIELIVLVVACFFITVIVRPLRPVAEYLMKDTIEQLSSVTETDEYIGRDKTLGSGYEDIVAGQRTRDYFYPDHSSHKKVVVMEYIIGSNLEDARGCASINIAQMKDATAKGSGLDFVVQAGGSGRWFTPGIEDYTVGRYVISGGDLNCAELLDDDLCMSEPRNLTDFIEWTHENYPADRYILVLWDHGGGFAMGYGQDDLNSREDDEDLMTASEVIGAIKKAGTKFDVIGFDACLMQNIEFANALEPYADYYLASEETEPGTGWFYTAGFGRIAEDPTLSTEDFGKAMVSSYDQSNRAVNNGEPDHECTLSLVDLTLVKPVYRKIESLYEKAAEEIIDNHAVYANMSAARSGSYQFQDNEQVDLVNYLTNLKKADYRQQVMSDDKLDSIAEAARACVVYRNSDSAEGINGLAMDFPYSDLSQYSSEHKQLKAVKYKKERKFFDRFCSIMGSQQMDQNDTESLWGLLTSVDYTDEDWYIKGFEGYDTTDLFVDIPVKETEDGYLPELPDKTWDTILDCRIAAYIATDEGLMYIGQEHFSDTDAEGRPLVYMDGLWVHINGQTVCYETDEPLVTEEGTIYRGTVRARLNGDENILIHIEWDPVTDDAADGAEDETESKPIGHVTGYTREDEEESFFMKKGLEQFVTGDTVEFLFDFYDEEGNMVRTGTCGSKMHVISEDVMTVQDEPLEGGTEVSYFGILTDVYQRDIVTEEIQARCDTPAVQALAYRLWKKTK